MNNCQSCGMPMDKPEDHGGGKLDNPYCRYCTDIQGNLLPREIVRQNMIQFYTQKMGKTSEEAAIEVDKIMATMPAWQIGAGPVGESSVPPISRPIIPTEQPTEPVKPQVMEPTTPTESTTEPTAPGVSEIPTETPVFEPPTEQGDIK